MYPILYITSYILYILILHIIYPILYNQYILLYTLPIYKIDRRVSASISRHQRLRSLSLFMSPQHTITLSISSLPPACCLYSRTVLFKDFQRRKQSCILMSSRLCLQRLFTHYKLQDIFLCAA